jgi:hypothetical protein
MLWSHVALQMVTNFSEELIVSVFKEEVIRKTASI